MDLNIDDLPPEILMKIFKTLDTCSLFACRLVSRKWTEISSNILQQRPSPTIRFIFAWKGSILQEATTTKEKSLKDFIQTFKESKNLCPYEFSFSSPLSRESDTLFDHADYIEFIQEFGPSESESESESKSESRIKHLLLAFEDFDHVGVVKIVMEKVKDLLCCKIPHLELFGLIVEGECLRHTFRLSHSLRLFPVSNQSPLEQLETADSSETKSPKFQLPHLKFIVVPSRMCTDYPKIIEDLLRAGVNLKGIVTPRLDTNFFTDHFQFFHSLGKLHLVRKAEIELTSKFLTAFKPIQLEMLQMQMATNPQSSPLLNLKELKLCANSIFGNDLNSFRFEFDDTNNDAEDPEDPNPNPIPNPNPRKLLWTAATDCISVLFKSSKDSLRKLSVGPLGFLGGVEFPVFSNLTELNLLQAPSNIIFRGNAKNLQCQLFPRGVRSRDIFPAVRILSLGSAEKYSEELFRNWSAAFPEEDSIPRLPLVDELTVVEAGVTVNAIATLALMCPNLKRFTIERNSQRYERDRLNFLQVGRAIWTHMTQLEYLEIHVHVDFKGPSSTEVDSCFTGIAEEDIQRLYELKEEADKQLASGEMIPQRKLPSILDMKKLKKMTLKPFGICLSLRKDFVAKTTSWISEEYAFMFMPHLRPIEREPTIEEKDDATVENRRLRWTKKYRGLAFDL